MADSDKNQGDKTPTGAHPGKEQDAGQSQDSGGQQVPYDRFSKVVSERNEMQKRLEALETKTKKDDDARLAEQGKYKELHEKAAADATRYQQQVVELQRDYALTNLIAERVQVGDAKQRQANVQAVMKLVDKSKLQFADGVVSGADEAIKNLEASYPMLFKDASPSAGGNPKGVQNGKPNGKVNTEPLTAAAVNGMSDAEFVKLRKDRWGV